MRVKKGNPLPLKALLQDKEGNVITDLVDTAQIYFMVKKCKTDDNSAALITKSKTAGDITINDPVTGSIRIPVTSVDTDIEAHEYFMAIKLIYTAEDSPEIDMKVNNVIDDVFEVCQNVIR